MPKADLVPDKKLKNEKVKKKNKRGTRAYDKRKERERSWLAKHGLGPDLKPLDSQASGSGHPAPEQVVREEEQDLAKNSIGNPSDLAEHDEVYAAAAAATAEADAAIAEEAAIASDVDWDFDD